MKRLPPNAGVEIAKAHTRAGSVCLHQRQLVGRANANLLPYRAV